MRFAFDTRNEIIWNANAVANRHSFSEDLAAELMPYDQVYDAPTGWTWATTDYSHQDVTEFFQRFSVDWYAV